MGRSRSSRSLAALLLAAAVPAGAQELSVSVSRGARAPAADPAAADSAMFGALRYRQVGPFRGGRVTTVTGVPSQPRTFYMATTGGGVWRTTDAGASWQNISDGQMAAASMGAIRVAPSNDSVIYVGTGSDGIRSNVSTGIGVYKSTDAGRTWQHVGLRDAGQIGAVEIHPSNPDVAFVAAIGNAFKPNKERGLYRTTDGGRTWRNVLFVSDSTGAVDVEFNPADPNELYATMWRGERKPWTVISGAREGGVYKSTDGGTTWKKLAGGLPNGLFGKADLAVSKANPSRVYVLIEAPGNEGGLYRSDDRGETWQRMNAPAGALNRPFYYLNADADPTNADRVFLGAESFYMSTDGGRTFRTVPTPHSDNHDVWINPNDPKVWVQANDGGANVTLDDGRTWSTQENQPTAEMYQVYVDDQFPYRLYGAQQDNTTVIVPSLPTGYGTTGQFDIGPGCETGPIMPHPKDPDIVYGACKGQFSTMRRSTGQEANYWTGAEYLYGFNPKDMKYRFQRTAPMATSVFDSSAVYYGSQFVHRSRDRGVTWETISPDLTANDPVGHEASGKPITRDVTGEEYYATLYAIAPSTRERGVIWAGANDGPIHVTRDDGKTWTKVTPRGLPPGGRVQTIEPSPHRDGSAYVAVLRYLLGDFQPYIYRTDDYGRSWTRLTDGTNGIPADQPTRVVREDPEREGLLYAGTEFGMYVSFDNGRTWRPFQRNLPATPVTDMKLHRGDLVLSTQGRGFWIMDDLSPLRQLGDSVTRADAHLFTPSVAYRMRYGGGGIGGPRAAGPEFPPVGARIDYWLAKAPTGPITLEILDANGAVVRSYRSAAPAAAASPRGGVAAGERPGMANVPGNAEEEAPRPTRGGAAAQLSARPGAQRFVWDLTVAAGAGGRGRAPLAVPGRYQARLTVDGRTMTRPFEVRLDPRLTADGVTTADLQEQLDVALKVQAAMAEAQQLAQQVRQARQQAAAGSERATQLAALESKLVTSPIRYSQPMLIDQLNYLYGLVTGADQKLGRDAIARYEELRKELDGYAAQMRGMSSGN